MDNTMEKSLCRICLTTAAMFEDLYENSLSEMYTSLTSLNVSKDDQIPKTICNVCKEQLEKFNAFKLQCIKSYDTLQLEYGEQKEIKIEPHKTDENVTNSLDLTFESVENNIIKNEKSLNIDDEKKPEPELKCTEPEKLVKQRKYLANHQQIHRVIGKQFTCDICSKHFLRLDHLKSHIMRMHITWKKPFSCDKCDKKFMEKRELNDHMGTHSDVRPFKCSECSKTYASSRTLRVHVRLHSDCKQYLCTICAKRFNQSTHLQLHMYTHTGERPYICSFCSKSFNQPSNLKEHISQMHNASRKKEIFTCEICSKTFNRHRSFRNHMFYHNSTEQHTCEICSKTFISLSKLKRHRLTHTNQKAFKCTICDKYLSRLDNLKSHMKNHNKYIELNNK